LRVSKKGSMLGSQRSTAFFILALIKAVRNYKAAYPEDERSEDELVIFCWGFVHGIAVLMVNGEIPNQTDTMALVEKVIQSKKFL